MFSMSISVLTDFGYYLCFNQAATQNMVSGYLFYHPVQRWHFVLKLSKNTRYISQSAQRIKHKLQQVMKHADDSLPLPGIVQLDDTYWGGRKHGCKRGEELPVKHHFLPLFRPISKVTPLYMRLSRIKAFTTAEVSRWSLKHLHHQSIVVSDGYYCFRGCGPIRLPS